MASAPHNTLLMIEGRCNCCWSRCCRRAKPKKFVRFEISRGVATEAAATNYLSRAGRYELHLSESCCLLQRIGSSFTL